MKRTGLYVKFSVILLLAIFAGFIVGDKLSLLKIHKPLPFHLGLDLQGGTHLVYEGDFKDIGSADRKDAMNSVREVIEKRVNSFGVAEPVVQVVGDNRLIVDLPGVKDINEAIRQIGLTPFLEFRELNPNYQIPQDQSKLDPLQMFKPTGLSGKHLNRSDVSFGSTDGSPRVTLTFNDEGKKLFGEITARNIGKPVAIFLDNQLISQPVVRSEITSGQAEISGNFDITTAKFLEQRLNAGALPVPIHLIQQQNVGPSLGRVSLNDSIVAGLIGFLVVALFMISYYRLSGLIAVFALIIYVFLSLAVFKLLSITLSLAGIAGFILSIGMAVDANILVFERTKEERRRHAHGGRDERQQSLEQGFKRAWNAIRDSNISSLITVAILGYFGTSLIRGFAITLGIGILLSMFTALIVTRTFLRLITK